MLNGRRVLTYVDKDERPSDGALQFKGDWPGLFVRGDNAIYVAACIRLLQAHFQRIDLRPHARLFDHAQLDPRSSLAESEIDRCLRKVGILADIVERDVIADSRQSPVGKMGVEDAMRLYMTNPSVAEWLTKTQATPVFFGQGTWKLILPDGWVFYNEYKDKTGVLYVSQIHAESDDPLLSDRIKVLHQNIEKMLIDKGL